MPVGYTHTIVMPRYLICPKCRNPWVYNGKSEIRTTCPACLHTVYLDKCPNTLDEWKQACLVRLKEDYEAQVAAVMEITGE